MQSETGADGMPPTTEGTPSQVGVANPQAQPLPVGSPPEPQWTWGEPPSQRTTMWILIATFGTIFMVGVIAFLIFFGPAIGLFGDPKEEHSEDYVVNAVPGSEPRPGPSPRSLNLKVVNHRHRGPYGDAGPWG